MNPLSALALGLAWLAIVGISWLGWQLLGQNGRLLLRLDELEKRLDELEFGEGNEPAGLPVGSPAPGFELADLGGQTRSLVDFRGKLVLVIFVNPACGFCRGLLPKLREKVESRKQKAKIEVRSEGLGNGGPPEKPTLLIITTGDVEANRALFDEHQLTTPVLVQKESEVATAYQANGTPSGYLISAEGRISSELAVGAEALLELAQSNSKIENHESTIAHNGDHRADRFSSRSLGRSKIKRDGLKAGTPAPDFRLPRLDGHGDLTLSELRGRRVLLVFSSPSCGPCNTLAPELEKFHRGHPQLEVVMVSKGEPKENRAKVKEHGMTFPVVLQQQWEVSRRYALFATPIAYLIDETGVITHDVAVGVEPILALMAQAYATSLVESSSQSAPVGSHPWLS